MDGDRELAAAGVGLGKFDDYVLPFQLESSGARGRLIRLGPVVDEILRKHDYPEPVLRLLGEAVTLTAMLGASLKIDGKFILQTQSDGPVSFLVVHYTYPGHVRGYVSYSKEALASRASNGDDRMRLLGKGHLAMTVDPGAGMERYQGIVALNGNTLADAAHEYFAQSEQIPTFIRIAVGPHYVGGNGARQGHWTWRAGGLMVQKLTQEGGRQRVGEASPPAEAAPGEDDDWVRARALAVTVEDHELLDPTLTPERLLYRLFHEEAVRAFDAAPLDAACNCSRERVEQMLNQFASEELADMAVGDAIIVTCEFCNTHFRFNAADYIKVGPGSSDQGSS
jgi:molecular chaperone Hsp33